MRAGLVGRFFRRGRGLTQFTFAAAGKHGPPDNHNEDTQGQQSFQQNQTHAKTPFLVPPPIAGRLLDGRDCRHAGRLLGRPRGANPAHLKPIAAAQCPRHPSHGRHPAPAAASVARAKPLGARALVRVARHGARCHQRSLARLATKLPTPGPRLAGAVPRDCPTGQCQRR